MLYMTFVNAYTLSGCNCCWLWCLCGDVSCVRVLTQFFLMNHRGTLFDVTVYMLHHKGRHSNGFEWTKAAAFDAVFPMLSGILHT